MYVTNFQTWYYSPSFKKKHLHRLSAAELLRYDLKLFSFDREILAFNLSVNPVSGPGDGLLIGVCAAEYRWIVISHACHCLILPFLSIAFRDFKAAELSRLNPKNGRTFSGRPFGNGISSVTYADCGAPASGEELKSGIFRINEARIVCRRFELDPFAVFGKFHDFR